MSKSLDQILDRVNVFPASYFNRDLNSQNGKMFQVYARELKDLYDAAESLRTINDLNTQSGIVLDLIGENLRQRRNGLDDDTYKIFLSIANAKRNAVGDIFTLNEVTNRIVAGYGSLFQILELCYQDGTRFLDGGSFLNGEYPLSGSLSQPATIEVILLGSPNELEVIFEFNKAIFDIKAGGIRAIVSYRFNIKLSSILTFNIPSGTLDSSVNLDAFWFLSGSKINLIPFEIALGNGAEPGGIMREPEFDDTSLQNEIVRKLVTITSDTSGNRFFTIEIKPAELIGQRVNEIALYNEDGGLMALSSFKGKDKDQFTTLTFAFEEDL